MLLDIKIKTALSILLALLLNWNCKKAEAPLPAEKKEEPPAVSYSNEADSAGKYALVIASELSIRKSPSKNSERVFLVPFDTVVEILEESEESETIDSKTSKWMKVRYEDKEGWIFGGYAIKMNKENETEIDSLRWEKVGKSLLPVSKAAGRMTAPLSNTTWKGREDSLKCGSEGVLIDKTITFLPNNRFKSVFDQDNYGSNDVDEGTGTYSLTDSGLILNYDKRVMKKYQNNMTSEENNRSLVSEEIISDKKLILNYYPDLDGLIEADNTLLKESSLYYDKKEKFIATKEDWLEYTPCMEGKNYQLWRDSYLLLYYVIRNTK